MSEAFVSYFFWASLVLFVWQLIRFFAEPNDAEYYAKHPRSGSKPGEREE